MSSGNRKLVALGIPWDVDTEALRAYMCQFGDLADVVVMKGGVVPLQQGGQNASMVQGDVEPLQQGWEEKKESLKIEPSHLQMIETLQDKVQFYKTVLHKLTQELKETRETLQKELKETRETLQKELKETRDQTCIHINDAREDLKRERDEVERLQNEVKDLRNELDGCTKMYIDAAIELAKSKRARRKSASETPVGTIIGSGSGGSNWSKEPKRARRKSASETPVGTVIGSGSGGSKESKQTHEGGHMGPSEA